MTARATSDRDENTHDQICPEESVAEEIGKEVDDQRSSNLQVDRPPVFDDISEA